MKTARTSMKLELYTEHYKALALEDTVRALQLMLEQYSNTPGETAEVVVIVAAKLLDLIYKVLQDPYCEEHETIKSKKKD